MKKWYLGIAALIIGVGMFAFNSGFFSGVSAKEAPVVGATAPNFTLTNLEGNPVELKGVIKKNKVTLLNFWATWCPPCRAEIPEFIKFYRKYSGKKVEIIAVNLQESVSNVKAFAKNNGMNFSILTDTAGKVGNTYQVLAIPTTFFIDSNGKIVDKIEGSTNLNTLEAKVRSMLGE